MAYIAARGKYWRAEINRKGFKPVYASFDTKTQAKKWVRQTEAKMDAGSYVDSTLADQMTLKEALIRYEEKIIPAKLHPVQERQRIARWLKHELAYRTLGNLRGKDFAEYRDYRRGQGRKDNTIRIELALISHIFTIAREEWGMEGLTNPLQNIRMPSGSDERDRRLSRHEHVRIRRYLRQSANPYAIHAFDLAIETTLRQGTLFALKWSWVDLKKRVINIPKTARGPANKGVPPKVPLSSRSIAALRKLECLRMRRMANINDTEGLVIGTSANAIRCIWKTMRPALGITNLRWHDLRHEGISRLFERKLDTMQVSCISGHKSMQMLKRYVHLNPEDFLPSLG